MLAVEEEREMKLRKQSAGMVLSYTTTDHVFCCRVVKDSHSIICVILYGRLVAELEGN